MDYANRSFCSSFRFNIIYVFLFYRYRNGIQKTHIFNGDILKKLFTCQRDITQCGNDRRLRRLQRDVMVNIHVLADSVIKGACHCYSMLLCARLQIYSLAELLFIEQKEFIYFDR